MEKRQRIIENLALAILQGGVNIEKTEVLLYSLKKKELLHIADLVARSGRYYESREILDSSKTGLIFSKQERKSFAQDTFTNLLEIGEGSAFFALGDVPTVKNTKLFVDMLQSNRRTSQSVFAGSIPYHMGKYFFENASTKAKKMIYQLAVEERCHALVTSVGEMSQVGVGFNFVKKELVKGVVGTRGDEYFLIHLVLQDYAKDIMIKYYKDNDYESLQQFCKILHIELPKEGFEHVKKLKEKKYPRDTTVKGISELFKWEKDNKKKADIQDVKATLRKISGYHCLPRTFEVGTLPHFHKEWFVGLFSRYDSKEEAESILQMFFRMRNPKYINMMLEKVMPDRFLSDQELEKLSLALASRTK